MTAQLMILVNDCWTSVYVSTCSFLMGANKEMKKDILLMSQHMDVAL